MKGHRGHSTVEEGRKNKGGVTLETEGDTIK